jgi:hypothetical protein
VGELIVVTGPPGAGKSTVSGLVADGFGSSVLIPAVWFFSLWHRGAIDVVRQIWTDLPTAASGGGYTAVALFRKRHNGWHQPASHRANKMSFPRS